jgi:hypothetical protein
MPGSLPPGNVMASPVPPAQGGGTDPSGPPPYNLQKGPIGGDPDGQRRPDPGLPPPGGLSSWLLYPRSAGCCGPVGKDGPIFQEFYVRNGTSFTISGGPFGNILAPGWAFEAGGRVLFFNPTVDAAWTVDLALSNFHYNTSRDQVIFLRNIPSTTPNPGGGNTTTALPLVLTRPSGLNITDVSAAGGREWYLWGNCTDGGPSWRVGGDLGGRWGSARLDLREIKHRTDVVGGFFLSAHSDVEFPCGCCIFQAGVRVEYDFIWTDILQSPNDQLQTLNLLFTLGARY